MGGTMSEHTQRDWFFFVIRDIKYAAAYGGIYANRLEKISGIIDCLILFLMSGAFSSFWLWEGHERLFGCILLLGQVIGSYALGAFIVAALFAVLTWVLFRMRGKLFLDGFIKMFVGLFFEEDPEDEQ